MTDRKHFIALNLLAMTMTVALTASVARAGNCNDCGMNTATAGDGEVFDELRFDGRDRTRPWISGVRTSVDSDARLRVDGDSLVVITKRAGGHGFEERKDFDDELDVTLIVVSPRTRRTYALKIRNVGDTPRFDQFWALPDGQFPIYNVGVKIIAGPSGKGWNPQNPRPDFTPICKGTQLEPGLDEELFTSAATFAGDRYSADNKVTAQPAGWFNLACYATAPYKLHALRHTTAGTPRMTAGPSEARPTSWQERGAMLRSLRADYLKDGRAWTGDGTPLWWTDRRGWFPLTKQPGFLTDKGPRLIEAVWGRDGTLLCLNEPRRAPRKGAKKCSRPAVERTDVTSQSKHEIPECPKLWSGTEPVKPSPRVPGNTPFDEDPWLASPFLPGGSLADAYIITVNRPGPRNYCGTISWLSR